MRLLRNLAILAVSAICLLSIAAPPAQAETPSSHNYRTTRIMSVNNTTGVLIETGPQVFGGYVLFNSSAAKSYVKFYDKATAPTVGTDTPFLTVGVPAGGEVDVIAIGRRCSLGLGYGITTGIADSDTTAPAANDVIGLALRD